MNKDFEINETMTEKDVVCGILGADDATAQAILSEILDIEQTICTFTATYNEEKEGYDLHLPENASEKAKQLYPAINREFKKECWEFFAARIAILNAIGVHGLVVNNEKTFLSKFYVLSKIS